MAILSEIRERIKSDLMLNGTVYDQQIDDAIRSALRQYRGKQYWFLRTINNSLSFGTGASSLPLPNDFAASDTFRLNDGTTWYSDGYGFDYLDYTRFQRETGSNVVQPSGRPTACAILGTTLYFSHKADGVYTVEAVYYQKDAVLPGAGDSSVWFDEGYDAIRSLAMFIFKRDAKNMTASEEDGALANYYLSLLSTQAQAIEGGR